jgi:MscS family membrane protein
MMMLRRPLPALALAAWAALFSICGVNAQPAPAGAGPGAVQAAAPAASPAGEDPLGRETPRGTFLGFITAAQAGNEPLAGEYLQWPRTHPGITKPEAVRELLFVLNHGFEGSLSHLSRASEGSLADGLPSEQERVGTVLLATGERVDILLSRSVGSDGQGLWRFAAGTVAEIPRLHAESGLPQLERALPQWLTRAQFSGLPLWIPLALLLMLPLIYLTVRLLLGCAAWVMRLIVRLRKGHRPNWPRDIWRALSWPTAFLLTVLLEGMAGNRIGIPIYHRYYFTRTITVLFLAGLVWWLWRLQDVITARLRAFLETTNPGRAQSAYIMSRRFLKGLILGIAILVALAVFGVNLSATLAGLGIGGLALAFAAQKTLENIFGGISVLSDKSVVVGDYCQIGEHVGTVEDVGLRTIRLRTIERTVVNVPNGTVATADIENYSRRDKFLIQRMIPLRRETSAEQLEIILASIRTLLASDTRIEPDSSRVRLLDLGRCALDVEVYAYALAADYAAFLAVQEFVLLRVLRIITDAGTGLAALPPWPAGTAIQS